MRSKQLGVAIIMALLTVALVAGLAASVLVLLDAGITRRVGSHDQLEAQRLMQDAIDRVRLVLAEDLASGNVDHLGERWAIGSLGLPTVANDGRVAATVSDLNARINLNNLIRENADDPQEIARFQRLLRTLDVSEESALQLVTSLLDWLDADDMPRRGGGAEAAWYAGQTPPKSRPPNGPLITVNELESVRGFTPELLTRLAPFITALPSGTPVNVNTAPAEVLAASVPGLSLDGARQLVGERQRAWFKDVADLNARLASRGLNADAHLLSVSSQYFVVAIRANYGISLIRSEVLLERSRSWPVILWQRRL